jgi:hypothetical protein
VLQGRLTDLYCLFSGETCQDDVYELDAVKEKLVVPHLFYVVEIKGGTECKRKQGNRYAHCPENAPDQTDLLLRVNDDCAILPPGLFFGWLTFLLLLKIVQRLIFEGLQVKSVDHLNAQNDSFPIPQGFHFLLQHLHHMFFKTLTVTVFFRSQLFAFHRFRFIPSTLLLFRVLNWFRLPTPSTTLQLFPLAQRLWDSLLIILCFHIAYERWCTGVFVCESA